MALAIDRVGTGAEQIDAPIAEINRGAVEEAAAHLDDTDLADDRETLKELQREMS